MKKVIILVLILILVGLLIYFFNFRRENKIDLPEGNTSESINWQEGVSLIEDCEVESVMQTHERKVYIKTKDGENFKTISPQLDDVFRVVENVKDKCGQIIMATE